MKPGTNAPPIFGGCDEHEPEHDCVHCQQVTPLAYARQRAAESGLQGIEANKFAVAFAGGALFSIERVIHHLENLLEVLGTNVEAELQAAGQKLAAHGADAGLTVTESICALLAMFELDGEQAGDEMSHEFYEMLDKIGGNL